MLGDVYGSYVLHSRLIGTANDYVEQVSHGLSSIRQLRGTSFLSMNIHSFNDSNQRGIERLAFQSGFVQQLSMLNSGIIT
jgi:hypothetical protein